MPDPTTPPQLHKDHEDHPENVSRNSRVGMMLFMVYLAFYGGFVLLSAFNPEAMSKPVFAGVNLAIIYGMSLILVALILAAIYMFLVRGPAVSSKPPSANEKPSDSN
ncbi:MAG: DUF485 domain-containing protein [Phycisphaeraceae bacterium]